ncbi:hypothetical protein P171DRAFT_437998 [Karstenula rhodostoma CBS 690.94]|uniref:Uncharacterized protein n=1 Tax=Karstenula rhodostoma CBS 690.94 TaxID=1392251 RepID=A0A9P4UJ21_9PLEO|nr:hypothetical protein P171DRAFT_437998 [Karstenula rhodostoma CBS 690.94]
MLLVGTYDSSAAGEGIDHVYAYIHSKRAKSVSFLRDCSHSVSYSRLLPFFTGHRKKTKFAQPFCDLVDRAWEYGSTAKLRAVICYYFMVAGYISRVGGYASFSKDFYMACASIAVRGLQPSTKADDLKHDPIEYIRHAVTVHIDLDSESDDDQSNASTIPPVKKKKRKVPVENNDPSVEVARTSASSDFAVPLVKDNIIAQADTNDVTLHQLTALLEKAKKYCQEMIQGNKRLKLDIQAVRAKDTEFRTINSRLTRENVNMQRRVQAEREHTKKLLEHQGTLNNSLKEAEKKIIEAETQAGMKSRETYAAKVEEKQVKVNKAEAERDHERLVAQDLRKRLEAIAAELANKDTAAAKQVEKERARANTAEAKLAIIQTVFDKWEDRHPEKFLGSRGHRELQHFQF